jgi:hypothetical protein
VELPHGLEPEHVARAMRDLLDFFGYINTTLYENDMQRFECIAMPANMSSIVGEFMHTRIPKYCESLTQNTYHNGHPDLIPAGRYPEDAVQYGDYGIEVKASRYGSGWQGHNVEECWLMVVHYAANRPKDVRDEDAAPFPFQFRGIYIAELEEEDWSFSGRSGESRRTITASVLASGRDKMKDNYVYDAERSAEEFKLDVTNG